MQLGSSIDLTFLDEQSLKVIAPFMSNIDPSSGKVYYQLYENYGDKFGDFDRNQAAPELKNVTARAKKDMKEFYGLYDFDVNTVFVATWAAVKPYSLKKDDENKEANTFQAVIISGWEKKYQGGTVVSSDEETAYVIFLYQNGKMNWNYVPGRAVSIGVTGKMFSSLKDLDTPLVALLDKVPGNTGFNGVVSFEVGRVKGAEATCIRRLANYFSLLTDEAYQKEIHQLYQCPCSIERLGLQWELYEKRGTNLDIYCYVLSARTKRRFFFNNNRNQLCCYKWLKPATSNWAELYRTWREASYISASYDGGHVLLRDPWYGSEFQDNLLTHQLCCGNSTRTKFCARFYKIFPDRGCSNFVPFLLASAFGDPHITSLDGLTYTMNGWGEWILLEVPDDKFYLQARTGKAETADGTLSNATVFTAFAAKESNESSFQVELSSSKTSMVISVNGLDITNIFYKSAESEILLSTDFITVSREGGNNSTLIIASFSCGVSVKVHTASKSLLVELDVLKDLQNKTRGLLGNFNGNKDDEFTLSDGTVLPSNISEREIYQHFAKSWIVTAESSVFVYPQGESTSTYQHLEFEPMYRDEADPAAVAKAVEICGDKNDACIFDYLVTGDKSFAESTKNFKENIEVTLVKLANNPPTVRIQNGSLEVNGHWFVYQGKPSYIQIIIEDEDGDAVTLEIYGNVTGVSANQSGVVKYVPDIKKPLHFSVRAVDSKGSYSPALSIPITVCPNCSYHGICDTNSIKAEFEGGKFQTLACKCLSAYTGENCESEIDACEVHPCFKGQTCTDLTAAQQGNSTIGYTCGPCPGGFVDSFSTCIDIDECTNTSLCDQKCVNTEGSYTCACNVGYIFDSKEGKCKDVNECDGGTSNCEQICFNSEGNFSCSCQSGYLLDDNGQTCSLDENYVELCYACSQVCIVGSNRTVTCGCRLGYEVDPADPNLCRDTDECQSDNKTCSQICTNKVGTYECSCFTGFKLSVDKVTCAACQTPFYGQNCSNTCQCNGRGTCDPMKGCVCNSHWTGSHCEVDIDECTQPGTCSQGFVCVNTVGSFKCACHDGYQLQDGQCIDIDECKDPSITTNCDPALEVCVNNNGSYSCQCVGGYARITQSACSDVDECSSNTDECEQICENKPGLYNCQCYEGFRLDDNRFTCTRDETKDPCTKFNLTCTYGCRLDANSTAECFCPRGYTLSDNSDCQDINECLSNTDNLCTNKSACENTNGSYTCSCEAGMKLDNDRRTCTACKGETWGRDCVNSCSCGVGADHCDAKIGCVCKTGYTGSLCDQDVDECATGQQSCQLHERCVNYVGGATCECESRYEKINGTCEASTTCIRQMCSFSCLVINGTETCSCPSGKKLLKDGINCGDCAEGQWGLSCVNSCNCSSKLKMYCDKANGSCLCKPGWTGIGCDQDIDECSSGSYSCLPNKHCNNTAGAYDCVCDDGFVAKGGTCKKMTSNTMSAKFMWDVSGRNLENKSSDDYLRTKQEVETQMKAELVKSGADVDSLTVTNLRKGSLIVDYIIVVSTDTLTSLNSGLQDLMKNGIVLDGNIITVAQILNGNNNVAPSTCLVRQKLDPCVNPTVCVEEGGTTVCRSEGASGTETNTSLILGLSIGLSLAGVIIFVMIILIVCYLKNHQRKFFKKRFVNSVSCETLQPNQKSGSGFLSESGSTNYINVPHYFEGSLVLKKNTVVFFFSFCDMSTGTADYVCFLF
ncbi:hypothetical protein Btru_057440 [Bulinus truncatus]|nr:hypothetical protein Btru_057440 [Bulinus truncatus]